MMYAIIRIRGNVNLKPNVKKSLENLRLFRKNHLVLLPETEENRKLLRTVEDYVTYGEINNQTLLKLIEKRGRISGNRKISELNLTAENVVAEVEKGKKLKEIGLKPVFRLNSPSKGFEREGIRKHFNVGGALGYRKEDINQLVLRMM